VGQPLRRSDAGLDPGGGVASTRSIPGGLVGLLEAVHQRAALDCRNPAHRVDPVIRVARRGSLTNVDQPSFESALQLWVNMVKDGSASKSVLNWGQDPARILHAIRDSPDRARRLRGFRDR